jgi:hypothetical protein
MQIVQRRFPSAERRDEFRSGWGSIVDQLEHVVRARSAGR